MKIKDQVVINSINNDENNLCIDFFIRNNNTFGYQEYRKDPENISGWYRIGNYDHIVKGFKLDNINAISTANILNFVGNSFLLARKFLLENNINIPVWNSDDFNELENIHND